MQKTITLLLVMSVLSACGGASRNMSVWDIYDIRHPVPAHSSVPVSRATVYDTYTSDNDSYYTQPTFGSCVAADLASFSCD